MEASLFQDKYPVFTQTIAKSSSQYDSVEGYLTYFKQCIEENEKSMFISTFDHYAHTQSIDGDISDDILAAKHVLFCFGMKLPNPLAMAVRPRSIGVTEYEDRFVVSFMEAPNPKAQQWITEWIEAIC